MNAHTRPMRPESARNTLWFAATSIWFSVLVVPFFMFGTVVAALGWVVRGLHSVKSDYLDQNQKK